MRYQPRLPARATFLPRGDARTDRIGTGLAHGRKRRPKVPANRYCGTALSRRRHGFESRMRLSSEIPANAGVSCLCGGRLRRRLRTAPSRVPSRCPRESRWPRQRGDGGGVLCTPPPGASSYEPLMFCRMFRCAIFSRVGRRADAHRLRVRHDRRERGVGAAVPVGIDELGQVERPVREVQPCRQELAVELLRLARRRCVLTFMTSNACATVFSEPVLR